jgi:hypothetical protein
VLERVRRKRFPVSAAIALNVLGLEPFSTLRVTSLEAKGLADKSSVLGGF